MTPTNRCNLLSDTPLPPSPHSTCHISLPGGQGPDRQDETGLPDALILLRDFAREGWELSNRVRGIYLRKFAL